MRFGLIESDFEYTEGTGKKTRVVPKHTVGAAGYDGLVVVHGCSIKAVKPNPCRRAYLLRVKHVFI